MAINGKAGACVALGAVLLVASGAHAASHAAKCEAAKLKIAGTYALCRLKVQAKEAKTGLVGRGDFAKCETTFTDKWGTAETKGGMSCPTSGDAGRVQSLVDQLAMTAGFTLAGMRYLDNGDGTITDTQKGLMWEKKTPGQCVFTPVPGFPIACITDNDCVNNGGGACTCGSDPHCMFAAYTWSTGTGMPDGTAFTEFLGQLNNCVSNAPPGVTGGSTTTISGGFAGHCDWRLPTIEELGGIVDTTKGICGGGSGACIDSVFGPTQALGYWSAITYVPDRAWVVVFGAVGGASEVETEEETVSRDVRAVRGGL